MKTVFVCLCLLPTLLVAGPASAGEKPVAAWQTNYAAASRLAQSEQRPLLLDFTGSDWCVWCHRLDQEILSQPFFVTFAKEHLILVQVDFPEKTPQAGWLKAQNERLSDTFHVTGYPTVILLDPTGRELGRTGYMEGGPKTFVRELRRMLAATQMKKE